MHSNIEKKLATPHSTDVVIIGAGPVGVFAVFECGKLGLRAHVVDSLPEVGGQCTALYPDKPIYDIPAHQEVSGASLIDRLLKQAEPFRAQFHLGEVAIRLARHEGRWIVKTSNLEISALAVLVSAGAGQLIPNKPDVERLAEFEDKSVSFAVTDAAAYAGESVVVAGGGDAAVDWALALSAHARHLTVVHRRARFRAAPESERRLRELVAAGRISLVAPAQLAALEGRDGVLSAVVLSTPDNPRLTIASTRLLLCYGLMNHAGPFADWGLSLDGSKIQVEPTTMQTNLTGVYAIGDIASFPGKLKLILSGFAEAATAAHHAFHVCRPGERMNLDYSTARGVPALAGA